MWPGAEDHLVLRIRLCQIVDCNESGDPELDAAVESGLEVGTQVGPVDGRVTVNKNVLPSGAEERVSSLDEDMTAGSLDALRKASDTSYFKDKDSLWVKVVSNGNGAEGPRGGGPGQGTSLLLSR